MNFEALSLQEGRVQVKGADLPAQQQWSPDLGLFVHQFDGLSVNLRAAETAGQEGENPGGEALQHASSLQRRRSEVTVAEL